MLEKGQATRHEDGRSHCGKSAWMLKRVQHLLGHLSLESASVRAMMRARVVAAVTGWSCSGLSAERSRLYRWTGELVGFGTYVRIFATTAFPQANAAANRDKSDQQQAVLFRSSSIWNLFGGTGIYE